MSTKTKSGATPEELLAEYEERLEELGRQIAALNLLAPGRRPASRAHICVEDPQLEEYVEVKLFRDGRDYSADMYVAVNGENCVIPRGQWFRVRRKFALVLDQSEIQDQRTAALISRESGRFAAESRERAEP